MKIAPYIKSVPHSVEFVQATDKVTGQPIKDKVYPRSKDFRTVGWFNGGLQPIPDRYGAVLYNEMPEGRILKPVGRDPIRVKPLRVRNLSAYEKNRGDTVPNFYQSLFVHHPDLVDLYGKEVSELKVLDLDIETVTTGTFPDPYNPKHAFPVCMIGYSVNNGKEVGIGTFDLPAYVKGHNGSDRLLLEAFAEIVSTEDPDIICTFNGYDFDLPYMSVRCAMIDKDDGYPMFKGPLWQKFALSLCRAKPSNDTERNAFLYHMKNVLFYPAHRGIEPPRERQPADLIGRVHYDILRVDVEGDQMLTGKVKNKKMKTLLKHFKFQGLVEVGDDIRDTVTLLKKDYERFKSYLESDVRGTAFLRERYQGINYQFCEMLKIPLSMVIERGRGTLPNVFSLKAELENNTWPLEGSDNWKRHRHLFAMNRTYQGAIVGVMKGNKILPKKVPAHIYMRESWKLDFASMYLSCIIEFNLGPDSVRIMYDYQDPTDVLNPSNPQSEFGKPTLRRIIPDGWTSPAGMTCMHHNAPVPELWEAYKVYLQEVDPGLYNDLFQTRFVPVKDDVGLDYIDVYFPDSKLNAQVHVRINSHKESYFRTKMIELQNRRVEIKKQMKVAKDESEKLTLNSIQGVLKVVGNSVYGLSGATHSALDFAMGVTITGLCRWCTETVIDFINSKWPNSIKEIDTDGLIVAADIPEAEVNAHLHAALTQATGGTNHFMRLEKEVFGRAYIYRMKNYIFIEDEHIKMHGATMVNSSHCKVYDDCVKEIAKFVLSDDFMDSEELDAVSRSSDKYMRYEKNRQELVTKYITNIDQLPMKEFVQTMRIKHDPDHYITQEMNNLQEKVVKRALELGIQVVKGSSVQYVASGIKAYDIFIEGNHDHNSKVKVFYDKYALLNATIFERFNISISIDRMTVKQEDLDKVLDFLQV